MNTSKIALKELNFPPLNMTPSLTGKFSYSETSLGESLHVFTGSGSVASVAHRHADKLCNFTLTFVQFKNSFLLFLGRAI